jgi:hypothetical protein
VASWASETHAILLTCVRIAEYFGTNEEEASCRAAMATPLSLVTAIRDPAQQGSPPVRPSPPAELECSEDLARILSPLLQLVCEPVPEFVGIARRMAADRDTKPLVTLFGVFSGSFARHVCAPVWRSYPKLAPDGWLLE